MSSAIGGEEDPATLEHLVHCLSHWRLASVRTMMAYSTRRLLNTYDCLVCVIHLQSVASKTAELSCCEILTINLWDDY